MSNRTARRLRDSRGTAATRLRTTLNLARLESRVVPATFFVTNLNDAGAGSLRQAIINANASAAPTDTVAFTITPTAPNYTISVASTLLDLAAGVSIDATTQPGYAGAPIVGVDGANFTVTAFNLINPNVELRGLSLTNFIAPTISISGTAAKNISIRANYIGVDFTGVGAAPGAFGGAAISVTDGASSVTIGGPNVADRNIIATATSTTDSPGIVVNPGKSGVSVSSMTIQNNYLGVGSDGTTRLNPVSLGSFSPGVFIEGGNNFTIRNNVISAWDLGIFVQGTVFVPGDYPTTNFSDRLLTNVTIAGNLLGTNAAGSAGILNLQGGIQVGRGSSSVTVGGPLVTDRNVASSDGTGNGTYGISVAQYTFENPNVTPAISTLQPTTNVIIQNNYVGVDKTGLIDLGNNGSGIRLANGLVGMQILNNVVSGNGGDGLNMDNVSKTVIKGNIFGLSADGKTIINNSFSGVAMFNGSNANVVGGPLAADRNVISGNGTGVYFGNSNATNNTAQGNYIGTDLNGIIARPNGAGLMVDDSPGNIIDGNVLSGNSFQGMFIQKPNAIGNVVKNNLIGVQPDGITPLGNGISGIGIYQQCTGNTIGGIGVGNVISSNGGEGIAMYDGGAGLITVLGNWIGTDKSGKLNLGNADHGIRVNGVPSVTIGGVLAGQGNVIANNKNNGVLVENGATGVAIRGNSIHDNGGLGIDLNGGGVSPNDVQDPDTGANLTQNFPIITTAKGGAGTTVTGTLNSLPSLSFALDFYASAAGDVSGNGEGTRYLGSTTVTTNANGDATYTNVALAGASAAGEIITATATETVANNTSEFAVNVTATGSTAVTVSAVQVNDGSAQHSRVTSLLITFNTTPTLPGNVASAFSLNRISPAGAVTLAGVQTGNQVTLTFTGGAVDANSLADGNYQLTILASQVSGGNFDGDNNGTPGDNYVQTSGTLYRLFGDANGDRKVDAIDFGFFRNAFNTASPAPGYNNAFDFNNDGKIDAVDFGAFRTRFNTTLAP